MTNVPDPKDAKALEQAAMQHLWMPTQAWSDLAESGVGIVAEAEGVKIRTLDGGWGYDGVAGLMLVNVGHGRQEIVDAIAGQLGSVGYANTFKYASEPVVRFAAKVAEKTPGDLNRVYFTSGGSEAVETALKVAYRYHANRGEPQRTKFIGRQGSYHGTTRGALNVSTSNYLERHNYEPILPGNFRVAPQPLYYRREDEAESEHDFTLRVAQAVEDIILEEGPETVAAVIAEPVSFSAGVAVPGPEYWPKLREICDRHGVLLIADEVITGWGRTGKWFCMEHWGVVPDMMTMAKGITSGYFPVGACVVTDRVFAEFQGGPEVTYRHGITYGGHPTGGAAGLANAAIMEREGLIENSAEMGAHLLAGLNGLRAHPTVGDVRGLGLMCGIELVQGSGSRELLSALPGATNVMNGHLESRGLYTRATSQLFLAPPLNIAREDIDAIVGIIDESLTATERDLGIA